MNAPSPTKKEIFKALNDHSVQLRRLGVKRMGLFGSFVRDQQTPESDVDLLVQFDPDKKTFDNFMELSALLESLFQRHVELVTTEALSPYIGPHIMHEVEYAHGDFLTALLGPDSPRPSSATLGPLMTPPR